jgi:GT2 family glycosyltransferase
VVPLRATLGPAGVRCSRLGRDLSPHSRQTRGGHVVTLGKMRPTLASDEATPPLAIIAIGRNEGKRLGRCLDSAAHEGVPVVYVDSGSTDGSPEIARGRGARVVELDPAIPFTAARARNEGLAEALGLQPDVELVQFVDGDCELVPGWLERGARALGADPALAVVCGRVRERERDRSVYNLLCDLEWDAPAGEARACGGNAMVRVKAFLEVGGFDARLIAGEEPELSVRLRRSGWRILRCGDDMVLHDSAMMRFGQWWRRTLRSGWAYAEGAALHAGSPERHGLRENLSIAFWGALLPAAVLLLSWPTGGASMLLLGAYPLLAARIYTRAVRAGLPTRDARLQAFFTVLGKLPQAIGQAQFAVMRSFGRRRRVVEWRAG